MTWIVLISHVCIWFPISEYLSLWTSIFPLGFDLSGSWAEVLLIPDHRTISHDDYFCQLCIFSVLESLKDIKYMFFAHYDKHHTSVCGDLYVTVVVVSFVSSFFSFVFMVSVYSNCETVSSRIIQCLGLSISVNLWLLWMKTQQLCVSLFYKHTNLFEDVKVPNLTTGWQCWLVIQCAHSGCCGTMTAELYSIYNLHYISKRLLRQYEKLFLSLLFCCCFTIKRVTSDIFLHYIIKCC